MKTIAFAFLSLLIPLSAAETIMNPDTAFASYVEKLNTHSGEQIAPQVTADAVFIFTEDTFVGKAAAKVAFEKTFKLIENEIFSLHDIAWTVVTDDAASCHYEFRWRGLIEGQEASGGGRGTTSCGRSTAAGSSRESIAGLMRESREGWVTSVR